MCNRYRNNLRENLLYDEFTIKTLLNLVVVPDHWPMKPALILKTRTDSGPGLDAEMLIWGLVPFWANDPKIGRTMTNARCETVAEKPSFRTAFKKRRCLIPATGFCEPFQKVWYEFMLPDRPMFAMAGLWEEWNKGDTPLFTFTMLTTEANDLVAKYHEKRRMPVILEKRDYDRWLNGTPEEAGTLFQAYPEEKMAVNPIGTGNEDSAKK